MPQQVPSVADHSAGNAADQGDADQQKFEQTASNRSALKVSNGGGNSNNNNGNNKTKLNGLKNRIIQRPPPLILDKVSNFYDNESQLASPSEASQQQQAAKDLNLLSTVTTTNTASTDNGATSNNTKNIAQQAQNNNSSANQKFWASLNQNATNTPTSQANSNALGPDLIITHRNSNGSTNVPALARNQHKLNHNQVYPPTGSSKSQDASSNDHPVDTVKSDPSESNINGNKIQDMSNNSELDDSSTHVASENDGGNLIGVEHMTPPASTGDISIDYHQSKVPEELPASATSSRPRSNNPFLASDEDLLCSDGEYHNSFNHRPASFIAATDRATAQNRPQIFDDVGNNQFDIQDRFNRMQIEERRFQHQNQQMLEGQTQEHHSSNNNNPSHSIDDRDSILVQRHQQQVIPQGFSEAFQTSTSTSIPIQHKQSNSIYDVYCHNNDNYVNYDPTINADSENTINNPPPSETMRLPHWTDAIYELNNAIVETSSIAGGAEIGKFIYLSESGDIILELDQVRVSGLTLLEFNELVDSKPVHLLRAVQTNHSQGLTNSLKHFLSCSFPKNSPDKELQDLIRENVYRRTIPCTTRPPKDGEQDKVDYHFLTKEQFIEMNNKDMLLECGTYGGHYYGTLRPFSDFSSLTNYATTGRRNDMSENLEQPLNSNHPAVNYYQHNNPGENPLYENHESLKLHQMQAAALGEPDNAAAFAHRALPPDVPEANSSQMASSIVAVDSEALPPGWERVIDQTHGTYYIDHNTKRTQYERPYEVELTKGSMGFGFTLVEANNGALLVRSVIPGGPAYLNGQIKPGNILISAVGVSVAGLHHTDIARLFSTFAVGDRVRLTFARSAYIVDDNLIPDEYLFSNGSDGNLAVAVNSNYLNYQFNQHNMLVPAMMNFQQEQANSNQILVNQEFEYLTVTLKRGDHGFGFTISDSAAGQKVRKIQNNESCTNLKQGDILMSLNGQDITNLTHKEVVERLKNCPAGQDVTFQIKRKVRFRSKTPMAMHTESEEYSLDSTPQRNCKTPNLENLMLNRSTSHADRSTIARSLFQTANQSTNHLPPPLASQMSSYEASHSSLPVASVTVPPPTNLANQSIYGAANRISPANDDLYYNQQPHSISFPITTQMSNQIMANGQGQTTPSLLPASDCLGQMNDNMTANSTNTVDPSLHPLKFGGSNANSLSQMNQYNNFMNNDKLVMMQMQQHSIYQPQPVTVQSASDYQHAPVYSNSDMLKQELPIVPVKPVIHPYMATAESKTYENFYANNEQIAMQQRFNQYGVMGSYNVDHQHPTMFPTSQVMDSRMAFLQQQAYYGSQTTAEQDEYEYHQVDLDRGNTDSNWGIRLIGGSEVDRAISIGSIVFGGAASKNGHLKSGDEIISINGINVVGATHQHVVELISACSNQASLVVRRKRFAEACEVVLTRNLDEGFGFVIISSGNCALIGRIIDGSPADRCQQLHVRDRIIAVNGRYITPNMQHPEIVNMIKECGSTLRLRIIPADCYTVELIKSAQNDNFGFSMRGGSEYDGTPLYILRVAPNGLARDLLNVGDQIIEINGIPTVGMTHHQAAVIIKHSDPIVKLKLRRNYVTPPSLLVDSPRALQKFNQVTAEIKPISSGVSFMNQDGSLSSDLGGSAIGNNYVPQQHQIPSQPNGTGELLNNQISDAELSSNLACGQSLPLYAT